MTNFDSNQNQLSMKTMISYGGLMIPLAIIDIPIMLYLPVFYSKEIGIDLGLVGLIFVFARIWDGITDPLIGWLSDMTKSRFGRRKPWVILATPVMMIASWHAFNPPEGATAGYVLFWLFTLFASWTAVYIPYLSWAAELSDDYDERSKVVSYREVGAMIANILVAVGPVLFLPDDAPIRDLLLYLFFSMLVLFPIFLLPMSYFVPDKAQKIKSTISISKIIRIFIDNKPFKQFVFSILLANLAFGMLNSVAIYLLDDALGLPNTFFKLFLIEYLCAIIATPLIVKFSAKVSKHVAMGIGLGFVVLSLMVFAFAPRESFITTAVGMGLLGIGYASLFIMPTSIVADIIDVDTVSSGEKRSGIFMAIYKFASKFSLALSVGISYGILDLMNYNTQGNSGESGIFALKLVGLGIPILMLIPAILIILKFPIDRQQHQLIRQQLES